MKLLLLFLTCCFYKINACKKPFFRFAKNWLHLLPPEVLECINLTAIPFVVVDDGSEGVPDDHLPSLEDQKNAINVDNYQKK